MCFPQRTRKTRTPSKKKKKDRALRETELRSMRVDGFLEFTREVAVPTEGEDGFVLNMDKQWNPLVFAAIREYAEAGGLSDVPQGYLSILKDDVDRICRKGFGFEKAKRTRVINLLLEHEVMEAPTFAPEHYLLPQRTCSQFALVTPDRLETLYGDRYGSDRMAVCAYCCLARHHQAADFLRTKRPDARRWNLSVGSLLRECGYSESMRNRERMRAILRRFQEDGMARLGEPRNVMSTDGVRGPFMELLDVPQSPCGVRCGEVGENVASGAVRGTAWPQRS